MRSSCQNKIKKYIKKDLTDIKIFIIDSPSYFRREPMLSRLKFTIQEKFGSQREFAQKIELHETSLSNIINEALEPSEEQKEKISAGLKENWDDLIKPIL